MKIQCAVLQNLAPRQIGPLFGSSGKGSMAGGVGYIISRGPKRIRDIWYLRMCGVKWSGGSFAAPHLNNDLPYFSISRSAHVKFGVDCRLDSRHEKIKILVHDGAELIVGDRVGINNDVRIEAGGSITIGADTRIGYETRIFDIAGHQIHPLDVPKPKPIVIGKNVWIGMGTIILPGARIGDHSVVAAGSVVFGREPFPARSMIRGNPAQVYRTFDCPDDWVRS